MKKEQTTWPTLEGRLKHPIKTRYDAIRQLQQCGIPLSDYAKRLLKSMEK